MEKKRKLLVSILFFSGVVCLLIGVSYSFFNYTRTGLANNFNVGRIYFNSAQNGSVNLTNAFPIKSSDLLTDVGNHDSVTINIVGDTEYSKGIEYLVSFTDINNTVNNKEIPISYQVVETNIGTNVLDDYWQNRGGNTSIYQIPEYGTIHEGKQALVGFIAEGETGISGSITITSFIDADRIAISDTYDGTESDNMGTTNEWVSDRVVFTTNEWNSLESLPASFKVKVEANEGIWVTPEIMPSDCFITGPDSNGGIYINGLVEDKVYYTYNDEMTEDEIAHCISNIDNYLNTNSGGALEKNLPNTKYKVLPLGASTSYNWQEGETKEAFCRGIGTYSGYTFQELIDSDFGFNSFNEMILNHYVKENTILAPSYCKSTDLIIPNKINNQVVTTINSYSFVGKQLNSVIIPNSVTSIGNSAFKNNQLTSVKIPNSVILIGNYAFSNNQLTSVTISNSVTTIGYSAFQYNLLTNVIIPDSVTYIDFNAFESNPITSVKIGNGITQSSDGNSPGFMSKNAFVWSNITYFDKEIINDHLFDPIQHYSKFTGTISFGNSVRVIGNYAFAYSEITGIVIPNGVTSIGDYAFFNNQIASVEIPNSVTTIGDSAFASNKLTSVTIGSGIVSIGDLALAKGSSADSNGNLSSITINKPCSFINSMRYFPWIDSNDSNSYPYRPGTTIYGANNEVCVAY